MPDTPSLETGQAGRSDDLLSVTALINTLLRQRRIILWLGGIGVTATVVLSALLAGYVARGSFTSAVPSGSLQGLAQVAQTFGVNVGAVGGNAPTLDFYVAVMESRQLLSRLVRSQLTVPGGGRSANTRSTSLLEVYGLYGDTSRQALQKAIKRVRRDLDVSSDPASNLVSFSMRARDPDLAEAISRRLLDLVNEFNVHQLRLSASVERAFVQGRTDQARRQLWATEDSLRRFLERNRSTGASPRLQFEQQRLQRAVELHQQLYTTLAQSLEQARIAEVRDTPVITVVDAPEGSALRSRHLVRNGIMGLVLGLLIGVVSGLGREHLRREHSERPEEYEEFTRLRRRAFGAFGGGRRGD